MARLVLLSEGYTGKTFELKIEQNTVGRTPDNTIEIPDGSVSSHHGEFLVRGSEVVFRDLGSTNGSYVGSQQITEVTLKPGMVLRLGNIDMRFETADAVPKAASKPPANTSVIPAGINKEQLSGGARSSNFNTTEFKKKSNKSTVLFLVIVGVIAIVLIGILLSLVMKSS